MTTYGFIGGGNMAKAIIAGLLNQQINAKQITATTRTITSADALSKAYGVHSSTNNADALNADVIILAVKPQIVFGVLNDLTSQEASALTNKLVISVMAGVTLAKIRAALPADVRLIRAMPNTPAFVCAGMTGLFADDTTQDLDKDIATQMFLAVGQILWVDREEKINFINAISGSGPAYFFEFIKAVADSGKALGLSATDSVMLAVNTAKGAALLAEKHQQNSNDLQILIDQVTSKGGTTIEAINRFREQNLNEIVDNAVKACYQRVLSLSEE